MFIICRECGSANPASNKECRNCGMPLTEEATGFRTASPVAPATKPATEAAAPAPTAAPPPPKSPTVTLAAEEPVHVTTVSYTTKTRAATDVPITLGLFFPHPMLAGRPITVQMQIKNLLSKPIEQIELGLASRGISESITENFAMLPARELLRFPVELKTAGAGQYVLTYTVKLLAGGQWKNFIGARVLWINRVPDPGQFPLGAEQIRINCGETGATLKEWLEQPDCPLKRPGDQPVASFEELANFKLPENFEPLELALDYQLSVSAAEESRQRPELIIPRLFVTNVQVGTKLKLTPANPDATLGIHLVARPEFKLGRSRLDSDYVAWFWPRSHSNDERTRHLSRVHVFAEVHEGRLCLRDGGSVGGSNFDGQPLSSEKWEPITRRATLVMAGEYFLDVQPASSAYPGELVIKNIKLWNGPAEGAAPAARGAVHFTPINTDPAHHLAIWLFSDAAFGSSRQNPIALEDQGLAEIQGRFHHFHGAFWLENCSKNDAVRVNYYNLKPNEIAPLINGQLVQIGRINYHVEVVA